MSVRTCPKADELEDMPDDDLLETELDEGDLIATPLAGGEHGYIEMELGSLLFSFVRKHNLGRVYTGNTGFRLSPDTVRAPDVAFVRKERIEAVHSKGFLKGAPDLAVEIFSWSDSFRQSTRKVDQYFAAGCQTIWVIHPDRKAAYVFKADGTDSELGPEHMLEAPEVLPGFAVRVADLFED